MADRKADQLDLDRELEKLLEELSPSETFVLDRAKAGDLEPLFTHILSSSLSPPIIHLIIDLLGGRQRRPAHRLPSSKTVKRQLDIVYFIRECLNENMSLSKAKGEAARKFRVSKFTVRNACKKWRGVFSDQLPE
jgi:hypothetical protein